MTKRQSVQNVEGKNWNNSLPPSRPRLPERVSKVKKQNPNVKVPACGRQANVIIPFPQPPFSKGGRGGFGL
jgi:hypothetical protein